MKETTNISEKDSKIKEDCEKENKKCIPGWGWYD